MMFWFQDNKHVHIQIHAPASTHTHTCTHTHSHTHTNTHTHTHTHLLTHTHTHTLTAQVRVPKASSLCLHALLQSQEGESAQETSQDGGQGGHCQAVPTVEEHGRWWEGVCIHTILCVHDVMIWSRRGNDGRGGGGREGVKVQYYPLNERGGRSVLSLHDLGSVLLYGNLQ